ncbi:FAD-dependent monooxygenase [Actinokineospora sp. G85]|uniref:FAD-dependent monooxygenase n=1 Tax=Actinokineospora sp. G85 TaxID=3406626 RepID=UPI003C71BB53
MAARTALISGASIAGPALAHWLTARGWAVTVVERSPGPRDDGQNIDVRGAGREVIRRMGLEDAVLAANTTERGLRFVDGSGRAFASFPIDGDTSPTAELEILRGQLSAILRDKASEAEYVYGDRITAIDDRPDRVEVGFASGARRDFDVVVVAEGMRSRTRSLLFPGDPVRELGMYCAYLTIPRADEDTGWWSWHPAGRGRTTTLRPDNVGTTRATLSFLADVRGLDDLDRAGQVAVLRRTYADAGWAAPRVLAALDDAPLYFESTGQVRLPGWSRGRVVLLGDAAWCASPVSGMGTSLALVGAYVLASELASPGRPEDAFRRYEALMRPYVERAQALKPGVPRLAHPRSGVGAAVLRGVLRVAATPVARGLAGVFATPPARGIDLPDYSR